MRLLLAKFALVFAAALLLVAQPGGEKRLSIYTAQTGYTLPVIEREGKEYIGLLESLEPMGTVTANLDGKRWKLTFNGVEGQFQQGKDKAKIAGKNFDLSGKFLIENGRGLVPVRDLPDLALVFTHTKPEWHATARRLLVGATPVRFSAQIEKGAVPRLALHFSAPVNPTISTEPGAVRMVFTRDPVVSNGTDTISFGDPAIRSVTFSEANGVAQIVVRGANVLVPAFADGNRTIAIAPPPPAPTPSAPVVATQQQTAPPPVAQVPQSPGFFVLIDPAHGGADTGAMLAENLAEKTVNLVIARRLHHDLEAKGIPSRLLRDTDTLLTNEQRATAANSSGAALVLAVHASTTGTGVHLAISPLIPPTTHPAALKWDTAQATFVNESRIASAALAAEVLKRDIQAVELKGDIGDLNNLAAPAVVVEIAPVAGGGGESITSAQYLANLSAATVAAVQSVRPKLERGGRQ